MQFLYPHVFLPQLANIELAFQGYLRALDAVSTAIENGSDSEGIESLRVEARQARDLYYEQHVCLSMIVLAMTEGALS
ncbi:hypothetical protein [Pseudomonas sp. NPDC089547]|uniref:hypothetical protein n=1 Tax=Pseudomonas sp. NPDC089547 TaxID=3390652 RepID=UPI003D059144